MADNASYPAVPHRPNFTDIRTMQIFDPVVTDSKTSIGNSSFTQLYAAGATLENGVRIKCTNAQGLLVGYYNDHTHTGTTGSAGFQLDDREEVFVEVRQLSHVYVKGDDGTSTCTFIAS